MEEIKLVIQSNTSPYTQLIKRIVEQVQLVVNLQGDKGDKGEPGKDGKSVELRASLTHLQWRNEGDTEWTDLVLLSQLGVVGGTHDNYNYTATGMEPNSEVYVAGIGDAVFIEVFQSTRWLSRYTGTGTVPENMFRLNANDRIQFGTSPQFQEEIYFRWIA